VPNMHDKFDPSHGADFIRMGVGAGGVLLYGMTLNEWVAIFTIAYFALQIGLLLPRYYKMIRDWLNK
jgi:hypothetical protein